jgi:hypothetical protein
MSQQHGTPEQVTFRVNGAATISAFRILAPAAGNNSVDIWRTATSFMFAVSQMDSRGATGTSVLAAIGGCAKCVAGASISSGALVTAQTDTGLGIEASQRGFIDTTAATVPYAIGLALDAADTNSAFELLVRPQFVRFLD